MGVAARAAPLNHLCVAVMWGLGGEHTAMPDKQPGPQLGLGWGGGPGDRALSDTRLQPYSSPVSGWPTPRDLTHQGARHHPHSPWAHTAPIQKLIHTKGGRILRSSRAGKRGRRQRKPARQVLQTGGSVYSGQGVGSLMHFAPLSGLTGAR